MTILAMPHPEDTHLLGCNILYHYDTDKPPPNWTDWNGSLTLATNHIIARFISDTIGVTTLPHHTLLISQLSLNAGGLGFWTPGHVQSQISCLHSPPPPNTQPTESTQQTPQQCPSTPHHRRTLLNHCQPTLHHPKMVPSHSPKHRRIILPTNHPLNRPHPILPYHPLTPFP
jgi:hypothetical protein